MAINIDRIIRSKRKTIALVIEPDGRLIVRAPYLVSDRDIQILVKNKQNWIERKRAEIRSQPGVRAPRSYLEGERFWYLGKTFPLKVVNDLNQPLALGRKFYLSSAALPHAEIIFKEWYRKRTREEVTRRAKNLSAQHNLRYRKIRITSARTRWGSCSSKGNLNFTLRLSMAPPEVIDYVVAHEMAHLRLPNHSKDFWRQVRKIMPEFEEHRTWLKRNGGLLVL